MASNFIGKAFLSAIKRIGLKPSDITDFINDDDINGFFEEELERIRKENNAHEVCLMGYLSDDGNMKIRAVEVWENGNISRSFPLTFFGETRQTFPIAELLKLLIANTFKIMTKK